MPRPERWVGTMTDMADRNGTAARLRAGLLLLVVLGVVGTALALAYERHWLSPWQVAPWIVIGIVSVATVALIVRQTALTVRLARAVAALAILSAVLGTWQHVDANLNPDHEGHQHADDGASLMTSAQDSHHTESAEENGHHNGDEGSEGDSHHNDDEGSEGDGHHNGDEGSEGDGHHHDDEGSEGDGHHQDDEKSSSSDDRDSAEEETTSPGPSFVDVVIGAVGHAPVPAALSLAPIGLALGLATIGLGGARRESQE